MNRRQFLELSGFTSIAARLGSSFQLEALTTGPSQWPSYHQHYPDMLASYMAKQLNLLANHWDEERARIQTARDVEARNRFVQEKLLEMIGRFPQRGPLEAVTVRVFEREGYRIENVMFQSLPDFWVTGNLYIPASSNGPWPAIISPCGHYPLARMIPQYQAAYLSLVKSGFVVLAYDPIGQGERRQYWNPQTDRTEVGGPVFEHSMPGQLLLLLGETLTQYFVWDGMRAIDYLLTRREVDPKRIGCAGHSGGGTLTQFISALDERVQCAAVLEGGTANRWPIQLIQGSHLGPADIEQNLFPAAVYGIDNVDVHVAIAPRPLLAAIEHFTPQFDSARQAIERRYGQLGVPECFTTVAADDPHAWTMKLRLATTDWFCRWFYSRPGASSEPEFVFEAPETLYCCRDGSLRYAQKGQTIFSLILAKQALLPPQRQAPKSPGERASYQREMQAAIREPLRIRTTNQALAPQLLVTTPRKGYKIEKVEFLSEPGVYIPAWVFIPEQKPADRSPILFISDAGMQADGMEFEGGEEAGLRPGFLQSLTLAGNLVVAVDVRGIGQTKPSGQQGGLAAEEFGQLFDAATALSYMAWAADASLFGMRVQDVIRSIDYAASRQEIGIEGLRVIGKGSGGLWALYAAVLDSRIRSLVCQESLVSYRTLTEVDRYRYGAEIFIPKVLLQFDLPEVAATLAPRSLTLISPLGAIKERVPLQVAGATYRMTREVYHAAGASEQFRIVCVEDPSQTILEWMQDRPGRNP